MSAPRPAATVAAADRSVLGRAFELLRAFDAHRTELTLSELSRRTGMPLATVHRLCQQLIDLGALERDPSGCFQIGAGLWEIGSLAPRAHGLRAVALPYLEDLYEATHQNVQLIVLDGTEALYIERLSGHQSIPLLGRAGGRLPLHASSGGLILLAHAGPDLLAQVLAGGLAAFTPDTITTEHRLRSTLADIRRTNVVVCRRHIDPRSVAVAAPVRHGSGAVVAAVSVVLNATEDPAHLIPALHTACRGISRGLRPTG
ncbi:IclR family transcriptional regulator [Nocardia goodfellowii]|uniref:DNA-binding IclR family transcriptional regulator n=1 Tax=Nocardia goodfellowii TaxID=882446 RepID=A0ABS4QNM1_9NOCA|nr:DNA-binding IclR family transcriptional regulator [Nocardia goodfellowii]